jgi:hypothetical protein
MASGTISPQAQEYISDFCKGQPFGENVYYLDGDRLEQLDRFAHHRFDQDLRNRLVGLLLEAQSNIKAIQVNQAAFQEKKTTFHRCRHTALDQTLSSPPPVDLVTTETLEKAWQLTTTLNKLCDYHLLPMSTSDETWRDRRAIANGTWEANLRLRDSVSDAIGKLDGRYSISVEVVDAEGGVVQ